MRITFLWQNVFSIYFSLIWLTLLPLRGESYISYPGIWTGASAFSDQQNRVRIMWFSEEARAPHSSTLAWKIPWTEEPGRLQSTGSLRVGHDWATSLSLFTFMHWRRKWQPLQCSCLESPRGGGAWWAAVYGVARSRTGLKRLSSSSSSSSSSDVIFEARS